MKILGGQGVRIDRSGSLRIGGPGVPKRAVLAITLATVLDWISMRQFVGDQRLRRTFCLLLATVNLILGYRSALANFITLPPAALARESGALGDLQETKARDRKPKPTRQQLSPTVERTAREKLSPRRGAPPESCFGALAGLSSGVASSPGVLHPSPSSESLLTEPTYLRPSEAVLESQLPPPV
jgi:hypothetical protein